MNCFLWFNNLFGNTSYLLAFLFNVLSLSNTSNTNFALNYDVYTFIFLVIVFLFFVLTFGISFFV